MKLAQAAIFALLMATATHAQQARKPATTSTSTKSIPALNTTLEAAPAILAKAQAKVQGT